MEKTAIIVQARTSSQRLPNKIIRPMNGVPMLGLLLQSLKRCNSANALAVATSIEASDDPVERLCEDYSVPCIRGPLHNVAGRFIKAVNELQCQSFVRICGDSPLLDFRIVDQAVELFNRLKPDLLTNTMPRTYPKGFSVEALNSSAFRYAYTLMHESDHLEHVTSYIKENPSDFTIENFVSGHDWGGLQLSVDTANDFDFAEELIKRLNGPHWRFTCEEIVEQALSMLEE